MHDMTPNQPYLLRAFYDWILDNDLTPYVVVSTKWTEVEVPMQFVKEDQIVLNVSPSACVNFSMDLESISFQARFGGQPMQVYFPIAAVAAIYAKENGAGTVFTQDPPPPPETTDDNPESSPQGIKEQKPAPRKTGKANLRVVK